MEWHSEPPRWTIEEDIITVATGAKTDFWRKTHYGFIRDNGHFYYQRVTGNFIADVKVTGAYTSLYDQAGLMVRVDETTWIKCGIEFVEGVHYASAVVTREYSDWSVVPLAKHPAAVWLRVTRTAGDIEVHYSLDGHAYTMLRMAHLSAHETMLVGVMCASPEGDSFSASFESFRVRGV